MNKYIYGLVLKYSSNHILLKTVIILGLLLNSPFSDAKQQSKILVMGDSLSAAYNIKREQGWVSLLQNLFDEKQINYTLVNASISGETTSGGLQRFEEQLKQVKPQIVILELGGNDGLRGFSLKTIQSNLNKMITMSHNHSAKVLLAGIKIPPNYGRTYTQRFEAIYTDLAQQEDVDLIPFILEKVATKNDYMQADGIHPNAKGQPLIVETVWPYIKSVIHKINN